MKQIRLHTHQSGVALIVSLLLLFIMILLGVSSFSNSHVQERSANNIRLQALAFEAASAGASNAIDFVTSYEDHVYDPDVPPTDDLCGEYGHPGWIDADGNPVPTGWVEMGTVGDAQLRQRMYCIADEFPDTGLRPARSVPTDVAGQAPAAAGPLPVPAHRAWSQGEAWAATGPGPDQRGLSGGVPSAWC